MVSAWLETNRAFNKAMEESNDFFMNVMFDMYAKRGLPSGALELLRKAHPTESEAQLRARYLCPFVPVPGQKGMAWERTEEHQDAAAAAVGLEEQQRLEEQRMEEQRVAQAREEAALEQLEQEQRRREEQERRKRETKKAAKEAAAAKAREEEAALAEAMAEVEKTAATKKEAEAKKAKEALAVKAKAEAVAEIARAEAKNALEIAELKRQADMDLDAMVNQLKFFPQLEGVTSIPIQLAMYSFLFCFLMRQTLMMDMLLYFGRWTLAAQLPPHAEFSALFKDHQQSTSERLGRHTPPLYLNCSKKTMAAQLIVQTVRNIVGIVLDLRRLVVVGSTTSEQDYSPEFHSHFQVMYSICSQRQFSMSLLEGIDVLGPSPELIALYKAVQMFETFCAGSDFILFRQCFPLPPLPPMVKDRLPGKTPQQTVDFFLNIGMSPMVSEEMTASAQARKKLAESGVQQSKEAEAWFKYMQDIMAPGKNVFNATRLVWSANFNTLCRWYQNPPALETLNSTPIFEELLPSWFGADPSTTRLQFSHREDFATEVLEDSITAFGLSMDQTQSQHQILAFLLAQGEGSGLSDWSSTRTPLATLRLPFPITLQEVRAFRSSAPLLFRYSYSL